MKKVYDITDKLSLETGAIIKIKDIELGVKTDAMSVLTALTFVDSMSDPETLRKLRDALFEKESIKMIEKMNLSFDDYTTLIVEAVGIASGTEKESASGNV